MFKRKSIYPLRESSPQKDILIMIDGTPYDWFDNDKKFSLDLAVDYAIFQNV